MTSLIQVAARYIYRTTTALKQDYTTGIATAARYIYHIALTLKQDYTTRFAVKASYLYSVSSTVTERAAILLYLLTEGGDFLATESGFYLKLEQVQ